VLTLFRVPFPLHACCQQFVASEFAAPHFCLRNGAIHLIEECESVVALDLERGSVALRGGGVGLLARVLPHSCEYRRIRILLVCRRYEELSDSLAQVRDWCAARRVNADVA
jgi:hypothetical protein